MPSYKVIEDGRSVTYEIGTVTYEIGTGRSINMPRLDEADSFDPSIRHFEAVTDVLSDAAASIKAIEDDPALSDVGKAQKRKPKEAAVIEAVATRWAAVELDEARLAAREAAMLSIPAIDPQHSAVAIEDREIRDWFRALPVDQRMGTLEKIDKEPGHGRVMLALMRSPVPGLDHEVKYVRDVWKRTKRLDNVGEAVAIDAGRRNVEWAKRGLARAAGIAQAVTKWTPQQVLRQVLSSGNEVTRKGYGAFGMNARDAATEQRNIDALATQVRL